MIDNSCVSQSTGRIKLTKFQKQTDNSCVRASACAHPQETLTILEPVTMSLFGIIVDMKTTGVGVVVLSVSTFSFHYNAF